MHFQLLFASIRDRSCRFPSQLKVTQYIEQYVLECLEVQSLISGQWRIQDLQTGDKVERRQLFFYFESQIVEF